MTGHLPDVRLRRDGALWQAEVLPPPSAWKGRPRRPDPSLNLPDLLDAVWRELEQPARVSPADQSEGGSPHARHRLSWGEWDALMERSREGNGPEWKGYLHLGALLPRPCLELTRTETRPARWGVQVRGLGPESVGPLADGVPRDSAWFLKGDFPTPHLVADAARAELKRLGHTHPALPLRITKQSLVWPDIMLIIDANAGNEGLDLQGCTLQFPAHPLPGGLNFSNSYLVETTFRALDAKGTDFSGALLMGADLSDTRLARATFTLASLEDAKFVGARLRRATFDGAQLRRAQFNGADLSRATFNPARRGADRPVRTEAVDAFFAGARLAGAQFRNAQLQGATFSGAQLTRATFLPVDLSDPAADRAALLDATWDDVDLDKAELRLEELGPRAFWSSRFPFRRYGPVINEEQVAVEAARGLRPLFRSLVVGAGAPARQTPALGTPAATAARSSPRRRLSTALGRVARNYAAAGNSYRQFKEHFDDAGRYPGVSWAYVQQQKMEKWAHWYRLLALLAGGLAGWQDQQLGRHGRGGGRIPLRLQYARELGARISEFGGRVVAQALTLFGESWLRPIAIAATMVVLFAAAYGTLDVVDPDFDATVVTPTPRAAASLLVQDIAVPALQEGSGQGGLAQGGPKCDNKDGDGAEPQGVTRFAHNLIYSAATFLTMNYNSMEPCGPVGRVLTTVEALIGLILVALIIGTMAHRISRS